MVRDFYCSSCFAKFDIRPLADSKGTQAPVRGLVKFCPNCGELSLTPITLRDLQDYFNLYAGHFNKPPETIKLLYSHWKPPPFGDDEPDFKLWVGELLESQS